MSNLFCRVGRTKPNFPGSSSLTILLIIIIMILFSGPTCNNNNNNNNNNNINNNNNDDEDDDDDDNNNNKNNNNNNNNNNDNNNNCLANCPSKVQQGRSSIRSDRKLILKHYSSQKQVQGRLWFLEPCKHSRGLKITIFGDKTTHSVAEYSTRSVDSDDNSLHLLCTQYKLCMHSNDTENASRERQRSFAM